MKRRTLWLVSLLLMLCSCHGKQEISPVFLEAADVSLTNKGQQILLYHPQADQLAYNEGQKCFRLLSDDASRYYSCSFAELPDREGQEVTADLRWDSGNGLQQRNKIRFTVQKREGALVWLWCRSEKIGLVVRYLR